MTDNDKSKYNPDDFVTGMFVRVHRDRHWINVDVARMTNQELDLYFSEKSFDFCMATFEKLGAWIMELDLAKASPNYQLLTVIVESLPSFYRTHAFVSEEEGLKDMREITAHVCGWIRDNVTMEEADKANGEQR